MEPPPIEEGKKNAVCYQRNDSRFGAVEQQSESLGKITPYMPRRYDLVGTCRDRIDLYDSALLKTALRSISRFLYGKVENQSYLPYGRRTLWRFFRLAKFYCAPDRGFYGHARD